MDQDQLQPFLDAFAGGGSSIEGLGVLPFFAVLLVSLLASLFSAGLYSHFFKDRGTGSEVHRAFPLLGVSITAIFVVIQFSLPLSLGLLGALSIVRFRTPIKEPEEIGFILLVVATSICCATMKLSFLAALLAVSVVGLLALEGSSRLLRRVGRGGTVVVNLPTQDYRSEAPELLRILAETASRGSVESLADGEGQTTISYRFSGAAPEAWIEFEPRLRSLSESASFTLLYEPTLGG